MVTRNYQKNKRPGSKRPRMKDLGSGKYKRESARKYAVRLGFRKLYFKWKNLMQRVDRAAPEAYPTD